MARPESACRPDRRQRDRQLQAYSLVLALLPSELRRLVLAQVQGATVRQGGARQGGPRQGGPRQGAVGPQLGAVGAPPASALRCK